MCFIFFILFPGPKRYILQSNFLKLTPALILIFHGSNQDYCTNLTLKIYQTPVFKSNFLLNLSHFSLENVKNYLVCVKLTFCCYFLGWLSICSNIRKCSPMNWATYWPNFAFSFFFLIILWFWKLVIFSNFKCQFTFVFSFRQFLRLCSP